MGDGLQTTIDELRACIVDEQRAIVTLDGKRLEDLTIQKEALAQRLASQLATAPDTQRQAIRESLVRLQRDAEVNRMLLSDALDVMAAVTGRDDGGGTYDGRAVVQRSTAGHIDVGA